ncbi:MAG: ATP-binding cassette domain-containing protein [Alphaproteobacteria bacterium]|nr:ATP-binding cassette domain-containing protein [Alphaproteobacteria bacterium]
MYRLEGVRKDWQSAGTRFTLDIPSLAVARGEKIALVGESGSGKSTLLDLLALILRPSEAASFAFQPNGAAPVAVGDAWAEGRSDALVRLRARHIGYVLQTGGLLPYLSVRDNIALPRRVLGLGDDGTVDALAEELGLKRHLAKRPGALSVGERQRVAVARALAHRPAIAVADEPTASVDPMNATRILDLFVKLVEGFGATAILATHDAGVVDRLGLRRLGHKLEPVDGGVRSSFWG